MPINDVFKKIYGVIKDTFVEVCLRDQKKNNSKRSAPLRPWMTPELVKRTKRKFYLWKVYKNHLKPERHHRFKENRNIFKLATRSIQTDYSSRKFSECGRDIKKNMDYYKFRC